MIVLSEGQDISGQINFVETDQIQLQSNDTEALAKKLPANSKIIAVLNLVTTHPPLLFN